MDLRKSIARSRYIMNSKLDFYLRIETQRYSYFFNTLLFEKRFCQNLTMIKQILHKQIGSNEQYTIDLEDHTIL